LGSYDAEIAEIVARHLRPAFDMIGGVVGKCPDVFWNAAQAPMTGSRTPGSCGAAAAAWTGYGE
jgi:hypothetical protein